MRGIHLSEYDWLPTHDVQPSDTMGAALTPSHNAMGSWADVLTTPLATDYHGIEVVTYGVGGSLSEYNEALLDFGWDPAGGTNYGATALTRIPYLNVGYAGPHGLTPGGGIAVFLPLLIPGGSTLGARMQISNAAFTSTPRVFAKLYRARDPRNAMFGTQVVSFGEDTANSRGTAVTISNSLSAWQQIAASLSAPTPFFWTVGGARISNELNGEQIRYDIGFGSSTSDARHCVTEWFRTTTSELRGGSQQGGVANVAPGDNLYVRGIKASSSGTDHTVVVHGVI